MFNKFLVLVLCFVVNPIFSSPSINVTNLTWLHDNYPEIEDVVNNKESSYFIPVINTLNDIWIKRDGATTGEISPLLAYALISNPELVLCVLSQQPDSFTKWLSQLQGTLFTDVTGEKSDELKIILSDLQSSMSNYSKTGKKILTPFSKQLGEQLKLIEVRVVD
jgi:hypothetical protein